MSTFAPPTGPPVELTVPEHAAGRGPGRRRPALLAVAVVALLALGIGAVVALSGRSSNGATLPEAEAFSLAAAAEGTVDAASVRFDMTVTAGPIGAVTVDGAVDNERGLSRLTMDLGSLMGLGDVPGLGGSMDVLFDGEAGVIYFSAEALGGMLPTDAPWVSFDLEALAAASGQSLEDLNGEFAVDPADTAAALLAADDVVEVGDEVIDGTPTRHYQVTVDLQAALDAVPQADSGQLGSTEFGELDLPDAVVYDVWVTEDNLLRRAAFDFEVAGESMAMVLNVFVDDEPASIELPSGDEVVDLTEFLGF